MLLRFKKDDFSFEARKALIGLFDSLLSHDNQYILLCGQIELHELLPKIQKLASGFIRHKRMFGPNWWATPEWYAALAATRMGDNTYVDRIIAAAALEPLSGIKLRVLEQPNQLTHGIAIVSAFFNNT